MIDKEAAKREAMNALAAADKIKGGGFFSSLMSSETPEEKKVALLEKAAASFQMAMLQEEAANVFFRIAELKEKSAEKHEASRNYQRAGELYMKTDIEKTIQCYKKTILIHCENSNFSQAGKLYQELGQIYRDNGRLDESYNCYKEGLEYLRNETKFKSLTNACNLKLAEVCIDKEAYAEAQQVLMETADACSKETLLSYSVKNYVFKAMLCFIVVDKEMAAVKHKDIAANYPNYLKSSEYTFLEKLMETITADDLDAFNKKTEEFFSIHTSDPYILKLIAKIKKGMTNEEGIC